jgi:hypothetical protein
MNDTPEQITGGRELYSTNAARKNHEQMFPDYQSALATTDPEFIEVFNNFAFDEVIAHGTVDVQIKARIKGNANVGHSKDYLVAIITQLLPCGLSAHTYSFGLS